MRIKRRETVYFVETSGRIKVGYTTHLPSRVSSLRTSNPDLHVIGTIDGSLYLEREIHAHLHAHSVGGEWFNDCPKVRAVIADLLARDLQGGRQPISAFLREVERTCKAKPPSNFFLVQTPDQLKFLGRILRVRFKNSQLLTLATDCGGDLPQQVEAALAWNNDRFKALVLDCFYPTRGSTDQETARYDVILENELQAFAEECERSHAAGCEVLSQTTGAVRRELEQLSAQ